jgi:Phage stabilisation protein
MAAAKQQQGRQSGRQSVRLPLIGAYSNRGYSPDKDQRFVNIIAETRKVEQLDNTRIYVNKRPGTQTLTDLPVGEGRSFNYFKGFWIATVGNTTYKVANDGSSYTALITWGISNGPIGSVLGNSRSIGDYVFLCDGVTARVVKEDFTVATPTGFPTPHIPVCTFIDGYICMAKGSDVYTCVVDNPLSWLSTDYLTAEMFPDPIKSLARQNNQVVVFGSSSTEFFYDAANATGSPLARNDSAVIQIGIAAPHAVYQNERFCIFVGQSESGGRAIWVIEGFQPKKISDEFIERIIDAETDMSDCHGYGLRTKGHMLFLLNLPTLNRTLVFDMDEKLWHEWASSTTAYAYNYFAYNHMADNETGKARLLGATTGNLAILDPDIYTDEGNPISVEIVTVRYDMDTYNRKFMTQLVPVGDRYAVPNTLFVSWTDDDYQTWISERNIPMTSEFPSRMQGGNFRRRAFRLRHAQPQPLRLESLEIEYDVGIS